MVHAPGASLLIIVVKPVGDRYFDQVFVLRGSAIVGGGVPDMTVDRIWRLSDGNPLFTEELLAADGIGRAEVTPRLRDLLGARTARLSADTQAVMAIAMNAKK